MRSGGAWSLASLAPAGLAIDVNGTRHRWAWDEFFGMEYVEIALGKLSYTHLQQLCNELDDLGMHGYMEIADEVLAQKKHTETVTA